jgi:hypothetical protein
MIRAHLRYRLWLGSLVFVTILLGEGGVEGGSKRMCVWDPNPRLTVDLRSVGYTPRSEGSPLSNQETFRRLNPIVNPSMFENYYPTPVFVDEKTVAVYFVRGEYDDPRDEQNRRIVPKGVRFHVFLLDAATGAVIAKREFPTVFRRWFNRYWDTQSMLLPVGGGRFLIHANNRLMLFTGAFQLLAERDLPEDAQVGNSGGFIVVPGTPRMGWKEMWAIFVAPAGRAMVLQHDLDNRYFLEWLNPDDLTTASSREAPAALVAASDNCVTYRWHRSVAVLPKEGAPITVCSAGKLCEGGIPWEFLDAEQLLVARQRSFLVFSLAGDILWSREGKIKGNAIWSARSSLEGNRFVIDIEAEGESLFGEAQIKRGEDFLVYAADRRKLLFEARLTEGNGADALSPSGRSLAILDKTELAVYDIPAID